MVLVLERVQLQSDCLRAVKLVNTSEVANSPYSLVRAITMLLAQAWVVGIIWIFRDSNYSADFLVKSTLSSPTRPTILDLPPHDLTRLLSVDMDGVIVTSNPRV
ncbi:hypothetical protein V6N12_069410 [Hibiscus sabdariffa]|uniref:RNase H type-1 domain-containing protein n=1 Tax=Hibiscus sabdariffa TaxID=183260 RepID=A0ABR2FDX8_9ROSI